MAIIKDSDERNEILNLWHMCSDAYLLHGSKLIMPKNTPFHKTYQWRYLKKLYNKIREWDFDETTTRVFINTAIQHAKETGKLHKGLSALLQSNILDICYKKLERHEKKNLDDIDRIRYAQEFFDDNNVTVDILLKRRNLKSFCNMMIWYDNRKIPDVFIALSKKCSRALKKLMDFDHDERILLPSQNKLYLIRTEFSNDIGNVRNARKIMLSDCKV